MEFKKDLNDAKYMFLGKERDAREMLHFYLYHYMKKRELHEAAKTFAEEANIEMSELMDCDESLLKDWWDEFWPQFCSRMTEQTRWNPRSSAQPSMGEPIEMLASLIRSQQPPTGNPPQHVTNVVGQPPEGMLQAPQRMSQRRAGKSPINTDTASILGHSASKEKGKGPLGFPPVKLLPTEITPVPHSGNSSHLQVSGTIQPPPQVVRAYRSVQLEPTYPAGQDSAYPPAAPIAGENNWRNEGSLTGVGVNAPDGPAPSRSHVPAAFFELMQQEAEERRRRSNSSPDKP